MGCGDLGGGEAWTLSCPPGLRIVGYGGSTLGNKDEDEDTDDYVSVDRGAVYIARVRFVSTDFNGEPSSSL
jgi:hypothetical protein